MATVTAGNIMTRQVFMAYEGWSIKRLAAFLVEHGISGAPVATSDNSMVGVVSASDIVAFASKDADEKSELVEAVYKEFESQEYTADDITEAARNADENCTIDQIMSNRVIKVDEATPLDEIARIMLDNGIRRVFVDKEGSVAGVVSTTNILRALVEPEP
jgi:predicted transcriptional regulator